MASLKHIAETKNKGTEAKKLNNRFNPTPPKPTVEVNISISEFRAGISKDIKKINNALYRAKSRFGSNSAEYNLIYENAELYLAGTQIEMTKAGYIPTSQQTINTVSGRIHYRTQANARKKAALRVSMENVTAELKNIYGSPEQRMTRTQLSTWFTSQKSKSDLVNTLVENLMKTNSIGSDEVNDVIHPMTNTQLQGLLENFRTHPWYTALYGTDTPESHKDDTMYLKMYYAFLTNDTAKFKELAFSQGRQIPLLDKDGKIMTEEKTGKIIYYKGIGDSNDEYVLDNTAKY